MMTGTPCLECEECDRPESFPWALRDRRLCLGCAVVGALDILQSLTSGADDRRQAVAILTAYLAAENVQRGAEVSHA